MLTKSFIKKIVIFSLVITSFAPIATIVGCFGSSSYVQNEIFGSKLGQIINESLLSYMGHNRGLIKYNVSNSQQATNFLNKEFNHLTEDKIQPPFNQAFTFTTNQFIPADNQWINRCLRTLTIGWDKIVVLGNLPSTQTKKIDSDKFRQLFIDYQTKMTWHDLTHQRQYLTCQKQYLRNQSQDVISSTDNNFNLIPLVPKLMTQDSGEFRAFFHSDHQPIKNLFDSSQIYLDDSDLLDKLKATSGSLTYISKIRAHQIIKHLEEEQKNLEPNQKDKHHNLKILDLTIDLVFPINFIYNTHYQHQVNLGLQFANQLMSPWFRTEFFANQLQGTMLNKHEYELQTTQAGLNFSDYQIDTQLNLPVLRFGIKDRINLKV